MTAFVWLLLAVCGIPVSAYRRESGPLEYPLQAKTAATATQDSLEKDAFALRCLNARGRTERNDEDEEEKKALQLLANLWRYTEVNVSGNITECKKGKKRKAQRLGEGFDVTCENGSITTLALKKTARRVKISELDKAICRLPKLRELLLDGSSVTGSLEEVKGWTHLERLHMRYCKVGGDLKHLRDLKKLKFLKLSGRNIQGSLHDLHQDFEILDLRYTSVTGNLSEMSSKTSKSEGFRGLWLQNTSVSGDIMDILKKNPRLQYLHLSSTKVRGALCNPEQEEGKNLTELVLPNSLVTICNSSWKEIGEHVLQDCPFPNIIKLDVTGCNLAMDVWDFLFPLAKTCYHLAELTAANCSLSGVLQGISRADNYQRPMSWQISILDLSHNKITGLLGQARACWLDVSHNSLNFIDPSYFKKTLFLDLRNNTPYKASKEHDVWEVLEEEDFAIDQTWSCKGVRPKGVQENGISRGRVLVTPNTFAAEQLCICNKPDLERIRNPDLQPDCCACKHGTMRLLAEKKGTGCFACFGPGCNHSVCYEETESKRCAAGYKGDLCAACEEGYRCVGPSRCKVCKESEKKFHIPLICFVSLCGLLMLCGSLWFWVWRDPDENTATERGQRFLELLEQFLLLLTFSQLLFQILSLQSRTSSRQDLTSVEEGSSSLERFLKDFVMFDLSWFLDLLSVQCMLGYELGRNLEVMVVSFSLPVLVVFALALGFYKWGSPFYGLKYAIVVTSIGYQVTIQCTWGNLFWCETKSARGWDLGKASFLSQRPFISCSDLMKDDLRYWLFAALAINGVVMPGGLCFLGMYIHRRIKGVRSLSASLVPVMQCESNDDNVTLHFTTVQVAAEKIPLKKEDLQSHVEFPSEVLWLYASAYVACIADSVGANTVEVMEAHFSRKMFKEHISAEKSLDLIKLKLTKGANFQELSEDFQQMALREARTEAHKLCKRLMYRTIGKHVTQREMKALWIGTRNSFERFGDKDPLLCEGLWKFFLLCMAKICLSSEGSGQLTWIAIVMLATTVGISVIKPFGSRSRNDLATVCFGALFITSLACVALCVSGGEAKVIDLPPKIFEVLSIVPTVMVFLFFLHLQLMPGDILLQANLIQGEMKKCLGANEEGKVEEKTDQEDETGKKQEEDEEVSSEKPCVVPLQQPVLLRQTPEWTVKFVEWYRSLVMAIRN